MLSCTQEMCIGVLRERRSTLASFFTGNITRNFTNGTSTALTRRQKYGDAVTARLSAARRDLPGCPYALVYTGVMMVYGRWRRRPRSGRVGHAVNRRTRPRQNLLYTAKRRRDERIASRWLPRSLMRRCTRVKLNYLVRLGLHPKPCPLYKRILIKLPCFRKRMHYLKLWVMHHAPKSILFYC